MISDNKYDSERFILKIWIGQFNSYLIVLSAHLSGSDKRHENPSKKSAVFKK